MATIDLPTTRAFEGARFSLGLDVSESTFTGALTGNRQRRSNLADRLRATLLLPPVRNRVLGGQREALLMGLRSTGDYLRMGMPHRALPNGNLRGALTVASNALAGARSVSLQGALAGANLLTHSGFEIDSNADGLSDGWLAYSAGSTGAVTYSRVAGVLSPMAQRIDAAALGSANGDRAGLLGASTPIPGAGAYVLALDAVGSSGLNMVISVDWVNASGAFISSSNVTQAVPTTSARMQFALTAPALAVTAQFYAWMTRTGATAAASLVLDNVQLEAGAAATAYAGLAALVGGDFLAAAGNLVQVAYAGAVANDAGAITVPLTLPLQRALTAGAAVAWQAPTGLWELDDEGLQLDYSAPVVQGGVAIPLRQVIL